jgi:tetratricopeptide (TPR) repeat protein
MKTISFNICMMFWGVLSVMAKDSVNLVADIELQGGEVLEVSKIVADEAYVGGDYALAIQLYEQIIENQGEAPEVYYNLGNSYYKSSELAKAILNYERALLLNPSDGDIRFNLELARSKTVDKITPLSEIFFITWTKDLANVLTSDAWAKLAVISFLIFIICLSVYLFNRRIGIRKVTFFSAIFFIFLSVVANCASNYQKDRILEQKQAIIMQPSITVKSTPDMSGTDLFVLHEGCKVEVKDNSMREWKEIRLEDGNVGWVPANSIEII